MRFQTRNQFVYACACMSMCVLHCKLITTTWKQINSAVNSTPKKTLCMYDWVHVCASPRGVERDVWARRRESVCWFDWFSQSHLKLWMSWSPSRYLKSPTSIPSPPQHYRAQCNSSPSLPYPFFLHAYSNHLLINMHTLSFPSFPVFLSNTHLCSCLLPLLSSFLLLTHTHTHVHTFT